MVSFFLLPEYGVGFVLFITKSGYVEVQRIKKKRRNEWEKKCSELLILFYARWMCAVSNEQWALNIEHAIDDMKLWFL